MQPLTDVQRQAALRIVGEHKCRPGALIEIHHGMRASLSFVPPVITEGLNLSRAAVPRVVAGGSADVAFAPQAEPWSLESLTPS